MIIKQEKVDNLNAIVKINLKPEDYQERVNKAIKDHAKKVRIPGFRPGMVPPSHIKKMYGKSILVDEINNLLSDSLNNYIAENKIDILGQPLPKLDESKRYSWDFNEEFEFMYEMGLAPEFEVKISSKDKFTYYKVTADEETINGRVKNLRRMYGKITNPESVEEGDSIFCELKQLTPDGTVFEGGISHNGTIRLDLVKDKGTIKTLVGLKKDAVTIIDLHKAYENDAHRVSHVLNIDEETAKELKSKFQLTVQNISRVVEAELNQEFFDKVFGEGKVSSEEDMRGELAKEVEGMATDTADRKLRADIFQHALDKFKINLPDDFLKRWLRAVKEKDITDEQIESQYKDFAENLKWTLIENKIIKENNLEIKSEEIVEATKRKIDAQFRMYSPTPLTDEQLNQYAVNYLQDRDRASKAYDEVRGARVFDFLKSVVTLNEKEIGYNQFLELK